MKFVLSTIVLNSGHHFNRNLSSLPALLQFGPITGMVMNEIVARELSLGGAQNGKVGRARYDLPANEEDNDWTY